MQFLVTLAQNLRVVNGIGAVVTLAKVMRNRIKYHFYYPLPGTALMFPEDQNDFNSCTFFSSIYFVGKFFFVLLQNFSSVVGLYD